MKRKEKKRKVIWGVWQPTKEALKLKLKFGIFKGEKTI
jgi:hypothetical protein